MRILLTFFTLSALAFAANAKPGDNYWEIRLAPKFAHSDGHEEFWRTHDAGGKVEVYDLCDSKNVIATATSTGNASWELSAQEGKLNAQVSGSRIQINLGSELFATGHRIAPNTCKDGQLEHDIIQILPKEGERSFAARTGDALHLEQSASFALPTSLSSVWMFKESSPYPLLEVKPQITLDTPLDNGDIYRCTTSSRIPLPNAIRCLDGIPTFGQNTAIWPGALLQGRPYSFGHFAPITIARSGGTISISGVNFDASGRISKDVKEMSPAIVNSAIKSLVAQKVTSTETVGGIMAPRTIYNADQMAFELGADGRFLNGLDNIIHIDQNSNKNHVLAVFKQVYYTVSFEDPETKYAVFRDEANLKDPENQIGINNPPLYVKSVDYGRTIYFLVSSDEDPGVIQNIFYSAYKGNSSDNFNKLLQNASVSYFVQGGDAVATLGRMGQIKNASNLYDDIKKVITDAKTVQVTEVNKGVPVSYSLAYLTTRQPASLIFATSLRERKCQTITPQYYSYWLNLSCIDDEAKVTVRAPGSNQQLFDGGGTPRSFNLDMFMPKDADAEVELNMFNIAGPSCLDFQLTRTRGKPGERDYSRAALNRDGNFVPSNPGSDPTVHIGGKWWIGWIAKANIRLNRKTGKSSMSIWEQ